ncbi:hypothetical protein KGA66_24370 [Actinocrinis puniceicyclus]|uniref:Uncharacterized protein n=1 Tax=Actinocrinis puniceicyclus TaxID=977794 RepID=A0A8J8BDG0_9ACTN|nr:hypothetical protein [Actinocrinis puniceicyclus]MBS2966202.1 hypothetical protein [Actinocrinis puniceicyclus]
MVDEPRIAYGSYHFAPGERDLKQRTAQVFYTASPRWSLTFADAIGLRRDFVPRIVAFDSCGNAQRNDFVVVDLANADQGWRTLRDAIADFMTLPASRQFVMDVQHLRVLTKKLEAAELELAAEARDAPVMRHRVPSTPSELVQVLSQPGHPYRATVIDVISRSRQPSALRASPIIVRVSSPATATNLSSRTPKTTTKDDDTKHRTGCNV